MKLCEAEASIGTCASLADLPFDVLYGVLEWLPTATIVELGCASRHLASAVYNDSLWHRVGLRCQIHRRLPLTWRESVLCEMHIDILLRAYAIKCRASCAPRRLRCHRDPASAASALQLRIGSFAGVSTPSHIVEIDPVTRKEAEWLGYFRRVTHGTLHIESFRLPSSNNWHQALHLHDESDVCIACAIQGPEGSKLGFPNSQCGHVDQQIRLAHAIGEFRHRLRMLSRLHVLDASTCQATLLGLRKLPSCMCCRLEVRPQSNAEAEHNMFSAQLRNAFCELRPVVVILAGHCLQRIDVGRAMGLVGSVVSELVAADIADTHCQAAGRDGEWRESLRGDLWLPGVRHVVILAGSAPAADTLQKAVRSISMKSSHSLPCSETRAHTA